MRFVLTRRLTAIILIAAVAAVAEALAFDVVRKVVFPKGRSAATFKGRLPREYAVYHAYIIRAKRGQRLSVKLTTTDRDASFSIYETKRFGHDEDTIFLQDPAIREYMAVLPIASEYSVQIYGVSGIEDAPSGAPYSVEIGLR